MKTDHRSEFGVTLSVRLLNFCAAKSKSFASDTATAARGAARRPSLLYFEIVSRGCQHIQIVCAIGSSSEVGYVLRSRSLETKEICYLPHCHLCHRVSRRKLTTTAAPERTTERCSDDFVAATCI